MKHCWYQRQNLLTYFEKNLKMFSRSVSNLNFNKVDFDKKKGKAFCYPNLQFE